MNMIDFHTHSFPEGISHRVMESLSSESRVRYYTQASFSALLASMRAAGITHAVNLPVMTRPEQVKSVNEKLIASCAELREQGIITFGGAHPAYAQNKAELLRLKQNGIPGIKLHPAYQGEHLASLPFKRLIGQAAELGLIVVIHSGIDIGYPAENFAPVSEVLQVIREVQPPRLVLAHMGSWQAWDQVKKELAGAPVWFDTAYALGAIEPKYSAQQLPWMHNLSPAAFVSLARAHGTEKILFATDSPWAPQQSYVDFIRSCGLTPGEQQRILYDNAAGLLWGENKA